MVNFKAKKELLNKKKNLLDSLYTNLDLQLRAIGNKDFDLLLIKQDKWAKLTEEIDQLDHELELNNILSASEFDAEASELLTVIANKMTKLAIYNKQIQKLIEERLTELKQEFKELKSGQDVLGAYKKPIEKFSVYIDKKY